MLSTLIATALGQDLGLGGALRPRLLTGFERPSAFLAPPPTTGFSEPRPGLRIGPPLVGDLRANIGAFDGPAAMEAPAVAEGGARIPDEVDTPFSRPKGPPRPRIGAPLLAAFSPTARPSQPVAPPERRPPIGTGRPEATLPVARGSAQAAAPMVEPGVQSPLPAEGDADQRSVLSPRTVAEPPTPGNAPFLPFREPPARRVVAPPPNTVTGPGQELLPAVSPSGLRTPDQIARYLPAKELPPVLSARLPSPARFTAEGPPERSAPERSATEDAAGSPMDDPKVTHQTTERSNAQGRAAAGPTTQTTPKSDRAQTEAQSPAMPSHRESSPLLRQEPPSADRAPLRQDRSAERPGPAILPYGEVARAHARAGSDPSEAASGPSMTKAATRRSASAIEAPEAEPPAAPEDPVHRQRRSDVAPAPGAPAGPANGPFEAPTSPAARSGSAIGVERPPEILSRPPGRVVHVNIGRVVVRAPAAPVVAAPPARPGPRLSLDAYLGGRGAGGGNSHGGGGR
jgi:hypothetical protein